MPKHKYPLKQPLAVDLGRWWINTPASLCFRWKILSATISPQVLQRDCAPVTPTLIRHFMSASFLLSPVFPFGHPVFPGVPSHLSQIPFQICSWENLNQGIYFSWCSLATSFIPAFCCFFRREEKLSCHLVLSITYDSIFFLIVER